MKAPSPLYHAFTLLHASDLLVKRAIELLDNAEESYNLHFLHEASDKIQDAGSFVQLHFDGYKGIEE